jgi:hypothetical protein
MSSTARGNGYSVSSRRRALVNTIVQFGGLTRPGRIGLNKDYTGGFSWALVAISGFPLVKPRQAEAAPALALTGQIRSGCGAL